MKANLPVSHVETHLPKGEFIYSITNLKGIIIEANDAFANLSNFTRAEMIGQSHNVVRHPEMPPELFADLWNDLSTGRPWRGLVKNRRKDGGFYWVVANVSVVREKGQVVGYQSIRGQPVAEEISVAEEAYQRISAGDKSIFIEHGRVLKRQSVWVTRLLSLRWQMILVGLMALLPALIMLSNSLGGAVLSSDQSLVLAVLTILYVLFYLLLYVPHTTRDLDNTAAWLEYIMRSGNLRQRFDVDRCDVIGSIVRKADDFVASVQATIQGVGDIADQVAVVTQDVHSGIKRFHDSSLQQSQPDTSAAAAIGCAIEVDKHARMSVETDTYTGKSGQQFVVFADEAGKLLERVNQAAN
ncbi:MAG: PAS domain-containing protein [Betaproteobacteria bacterium]